MKNPNNLVKKVASKRKCWLDQHGDDGFTLRCGPLGDSLGSLLGPIRRNSVGQYKDGTYAWCLNIGGMVRAHTLEEAAQKWAASKHVNWEIVSKEDAL